MAIEEEFEKTRQLIYEVSEKSKRLLLIGVKNFLNVDDVAVYLGISKSVVYGLMRTKQIPYSKPNGKLAFFKKSDVDAWLGSNRIASASEVEEQAARYCVAHKKGGAA